MSAAWSGGEVSRRPLRLPGGGGSAVTTGRDPVAWPEEGSISMEVQRLRAVGRHVSGQPPGLLLDEAADAPGVAVAADLALALLLHPLERLPVDGEPARHLPVRGRHAGRGGSS
jgi:hypothetical protein